MRGLSQVPFTGDSLYPLYPPTRSPRRTLFGATNHHSCHASLIRTRSTKPASAAGASCAPTGDAAIAEFVLRVRTLGPAYHEHASVRDWLREPGLTEDEKLATVDTHADAIRVSAATTPGAGG